jgi:hypothetical protein
MSRSLLFDDIAYQSRELLLSGQARGEILIKHKNSLTKDNKRKIIGMTA